jgi:hypothetical protein
MGRAVPDQAEWSLDLVRVTPVKIPIPNKMTQAMTTYSGRTPAVMRAHATPPIKIRNPTI